MRRLPIVLALIAGAAACPPALAQPHRPASVPGRADRVTALFQAADHGDAAPLQQALRGEHDPDLRALMAGRLAAMRLDPAVLANGRLQRIAAASPIPSLRRAALSVLTSAAFAQGRYAEAARNGRVLTRLQRAAHEAEADETEQTTRLAEVLASLPALAVEQHSGGGTAAARRDAAGLMRVDLLIGGQTQDAVFDTGANLSVLSAAAARRLGVRVLDSNASVGNSIQSNVAVRLAVAERVEIAGTVLRNVKFLVIDDAALAFPMPGSSYTIPAILGFPEMRALGRIRMEAGRMTVETPRPGGGAANLRALESSLVVDGRIGGVPVPLHLDSGANPSHLTPLFAAAHPEIVGGLAQENRRLAGAGGSTTGRAVRWRDVPVTLGGGTARLPALLVDVAGGGGKPSPYYGVAGADLLGRFSSYTIDLVGMRLELGAPVAEAAGH